MSTDSQVVWLSELITNQQVVFRIGRTGDRLIAEWPGLATLRTDRATGWSQLEVAPGVDFKWHAKLERGLASAMLRQVRGELTLHASALAWSDRAVLLLGQSGAGKSTLAAVLASRPEMRLLADDTSPISFEGDHAFVSTGDPELWLLEDARVALGVQDRGPGKRPLAFSPQPMDQVKIRAIVALSYGDVAQPILSPLRGHGALSRLLEGTVRFVIDEPAMQLREISQLEKLARATSIYELIRPCALNRIAESADVIADLFRKVPPQ
jgi:hypothetical protein